MSPRRLKDDERVLWQGVTRSIAPLKKSAKAEADDEAPVAAKPAAKPRPRPAALSVVPPPPKSAAPRLAAPPPLAPLGRRAKKRIARGNQSIDARLDLHGMTQAEAHDALLGFLRRMQAKGGRLVLVITGKGSADAYGGRGVLKRAVPLWLRLPEFRSFVSGFENAAVGHGGEGALYVTVRRAHG
jgi:DNA-nicking Smr family endonuclease